MTAVPWPPRRRDGSAVVPMAPGISAEPFLGTWCNTLAATQGFVRLDVERRDGGVAVRTLGGGGEVVDWGTDLELYVDIAPGRPIAFSVEKSFGATTGVLQANLNLGLLVLGTYRAGRGVGWFSREFFRRVAPRPPLAPPRSAAVGIFAGVAVPERVDTGAIAGRWRNADPGSDGIAEVVIAVRDGEPSVEVRGSGPPGTAPCSWGDAEVGVYAAVDEAGHQTLSLLADYRSPDLRSRLQLRWPAGTLALAGFERFPARRRPSYFTREFFVRVDDDAVAAP